jgi:hypothetical protein
VSSLVLLPAVAVGASLLVVSGVTKVRDPRSALGSLRLSGGAAATGMRLAGAAEAAVGTAVLVSPTRAATAALALAYCVFAAVVEWQRRQPGVTSCGCLGSRSAPPSRVHTSLDLALAAAAAGAAWLGAMPSVTAAWQDSPPLGLVAAVGIAAATALAAAVIRELPELLSSYQRPVQR